MGVRGLTTYISKRSDRYLEPYELKCCTIVIDGNNIACQLYNWFSKCNCAFGGDYDKYANCVKEFFTLLLKCEVKPLVIFDGGYETKKLPTVRERLKKKLQTAKCVNPMTQSKLHVFPLFMKDVFMDVLRSLKISFAQSDFEADSEIAAIARQLKCPVLSYDSDFYVYDVLYIPFSSVVLEAVKYTEANDKSVKYYISCSIYRIETFLNSLGGLDKSLLPVLAVVLGNDYIEKQVLQNFLSQIKCPKHRSLNNTQRQIVGILEWLRNEKLETAVTKILSHLKKQKRSSVSRQLKEIISGYKNTSSCLLPYLKISDAGEVPSNVDDCSINFNIKHIEAHQNCEIESIESGEENIQEDGEEEDDEIEEEKGAEKEDVIEDEGNQQSEMFDSHIGYCRSKNSFLKEHGSQLKKTDESERLSGTSSQEEFNVNVSVAEAIAAVSKEDCLSAFDNILPFHIMDETLKTRTKIFSLEVLHAFAQFQSCAYFINHLNALLDFPFPSCQIGHFYSGTVIYNACMNFKKRSNVEIYICKHILNFRSLRLLYEVLFSKVACFLPKLFKIDMLKKTNQKRKKKRTKKSATLSEKGVNLSENEQNTDESESSEFAEFMKNNRFSALTCKS
ncbi:hypothetical protein L9F63_020736 [Diploptera punctata]|uniref:XPG N-terminal domain-containing protein n=1 Tax=Diploptera punctata TaxID=6984 RepID=A0AAD7ZQD1_DIPPU|nr:hypothetical protein L9F63_020736 [Diploptera punctata]